MGCVQSKVVAVNMLIQNDFLKTNRLKNGRFLDPIRGPIRHALSTIRDAILVRHRTAIGALQFSLACKRARLGF
jgi:hypothetical protein